MSPPSTISLTSSTLGCCPHFHFQSDRRLVYRLRWLQYITSAGNPEDPKQPSVPSLGQLSAHRHPPRYTIVEFVITLPPNRQRLKSKRKKREKNKTSKEYLLFNKVVIFIW
jgi:hypothetical protein